MNHASSNEAESRPSDQTRSSNESVVSCNSCRARKLRCSRELPRCQQCRKTNGDCEYKEKKQPGMKPGAIESLHRRLDQMEESLNELRDTRPQGNDERAVQNVMAVLAQEIHRISQVPSSSQCQPTQSHERSNKRQRLDSQDQEQLGPFGITPPLLSPAVLDQVIDAYFSRVHPWIPMLQENRFKQRLGDPEENSRLFTVLQAITVVAIRLVGPIHLYGMTEQKLKMIRDWVVTTAMSSLVIESLQALTIIAFNDIGHGRAMTAWPIIGSLTRTVEYLQLTVEQDDSTRPPPLSRPYVTSALRDIATVSWIELEERRRTFWVIFNLDRFCSVTMGWNTSLTSDDVCRRLPCDISLWWQDEPVLTPYFNIWDKSAGRIGNPIAFPPPHREQEELDGEVAAAQNSTNNTGEAQDLLTMDGSTIGAFAYSVEATESLSQVTAYFLQQRVNMRDERAIESWLTRFKELDLRLIHWKMLLPQKWKPDMGRRHSTVRMDPNLTLAHVTHNASIVMLHQSIAFPRLEWAFRNRLPSLSSADTCHSAAAMVAVITKNYLDMLPAIPVTHLFAFCIFVCARALLIHWRYYSTTRLSPEFDSLIHSLDRVSAQWRGLGAGSERWPDDGSANNTLAGLYASRLRRLRHRCQNDANFCIDPSDYTMDGGDAQEAWSASSAVSNNINTAGPLEYHPSPSRESQASPRSSRTTTTPIAMLQSSSLAYHRDQHPIVPDVTTTIPQGQHDMPDDGTMDSIAQLFHDPQYVDVDRIISLEDDIFDVGSEIPWQ